MFGIGFTELIIIAIIALVVLGPEKLMTMAKVIGRLLGKLRHQYNSVKEEIEREVRIEDMRKHLASEEKALRESFDNVQNAVNETGAALKKDTETLLTDNRIGAVKTESDSTHT